MKHWRLYYATLLYGLLIVVDVYSNRFNPIQDLGTIILLAAIGALLLYIVKLALRLKNVRTIFGTQLTEGEILIIASVIYPIIRFADLIFT